MNFPKVKRSKNITYNSGCIFYKQKTQDFSRFAYILTCTKH